VLSLVVLEFQFERSFKTKI